MTFQSNRDWQKLDRVTDPQPKDWNSGQDIRPAGGRLAKQNTDSAQMSREISRIPGCRTKPIR